MDRSNSLKIRAVILDYEEVLCHPPTAEEMGRMASLFKVGPDLFRELWSGTVASMIAATFPLRAIGRSSQKMPT